MALNGEGLVVEPESTPLLEDPSRRIEVPAVASCLLDAFVLDLRHIDSSVPRGEEC